MSADTVPGLAEVLTKHAPIGDTDGGASIECDNVGCGVYLPGPDWSDHIAAALTPLIEAHVEQRIAKADIPNMAEYDRGFGDGQAAALAPVLALADEWERTGPSIGMRPPWYARELRAAAGQNEQAPDRHDDEAGE